ncbi:MAG: hypothetical protein HKN45_02320 [Flavobacteriales bacterium]|nr:hypothetical protein [Flavobacteriales bacterium]
MIKFFRRIRYDLMGKNKTGKYLKYAIGEIILVVIGILIAVQINDWNETRKVKQGSRVHLQKMILELETTKVRMEYLTSNVEGKYSFGYSALDKAVADCDSLLKLSYAGFTERDISYILNTPFIGGQASLNIQQAAYEEVKGAGGLNTLGSEELISAIKAYYSRIQRESEYTDENNLLITRARHILEDGLGRLQMDYQLDPTGFDIDNYPWLFDHTSEEYKDLQKGIYITNRWQKDTREKMLAISDLSDSLIRMIQDELATRD